VIATADELHHRSLLQRLGQSWVTATHFVLGDAGGGGEPGYRRDAGWDRHAIRLRDGAGLDLAGGALAQAKELDVSLEVGGLDRIEARRVWRRSAFARPR